MGFTLTFIQCFVLFLPLVAPILLFLVTIIVVLGQWVSHIEEWNKFDGLYWSLVTATTVGYGDIRPLKKISKVLAVVIAIIGLVLGGIVVSLALEATSFSVEKHLDTQTLEKLKKELSFEDLGTNLSKKSGYNASDCKKSPAKILCIPIIVCCLKSMLDKAEIDEFPNVKNTH